MIVSMECAYLEQQDSLSFERCSYHIDMPTNLDRRGKNNVHNIFVINVSIYYIYSIHWV